MLRHKKQRRQDKASLAAAEVQFVVFLKGLRLHFVAGTTEAVAKCIYWNFVDRFKHPMNFSRAHFAAKPPASLCNQKLPFLLASTPVGTNRHASGLDATFAFVLPLS